MSDRGLALRSSGSPRARVRSTQAARGIWSDHHDVPIVEVVEVLADLGEANRVCRVRPVLGVEQPAAVLVVEDLLLWRLRLGADVEPVRFKRPQRPETFEGGFLQGDDVAFGEVGDLVLVVGMGEDERVISLAAGEFIAARAAVETVVSRSAVELVFALVAFESRRRRRHR